MTSRGSRSQSTPAAPKPRFSFGTTNTSASGPKKVNTFFLWLSLTLESGQLWASKNKTNIQLLMIRLIMMVMIFVMMVMIFRCRWWWCLIMMIMILVMVLVVMLVIVVMVMIFRCRWTAWWWGRLLHQTWLSLRPGEISADFCTLNFSLWLCVHFCVFALDPRLKILMFKITGSGLWPTRATSREAARLTTITITTKAIIITNSIIKKAIPLAST